MLKPPGMNGNLVIIPLVGQAPILQKMLQAILEDHRDKSNGCVSARCWVNAYHVSISQLQAARIDAIYALLN